MSYISSLTKQKTKYKGSFIKASILLLYTYERDCVSDIKNYQ